MRGDAAGPRVRVATAAIAIALSLGACSEGERATDLALDGSPRVPDAEGIASIARPDLIEIAGKQYKVSPDLVSFSTHDLALTPLVRWEGSYVQVGLDGDTVVWLAGVTGVVTGERPIAEFAAVIDDVDGNEVVLEGGTVVTLGDGVKARPAGTYVLVRLDPITGRVRELLPI